MTTKTANSQHVVVDGSNIATEGRSMPSLAQLNEAVNSYIADHPGVTVTVVVDATFGHRIAQSEVKEFDAAIANNELVAPPAGAIGRGDAFVLSIAKKAKATILSNDSFQEFHGEHDWLFDDGRLVGGKPVPHVGWVWVARSPVRGPISRKSVRASKPPPARGAASDGGPKADREPAARRGSTRRASKEATGPMPVPTMPPPGRAATAGDGKGAAAPSTQPGDVVNDLMPFLDFVQHHPVGTSVNAIVDSYSSHGAYVKIGEVFGYVPLRLMSDPPPRSAREVMKIGDAVTLVVASFAPARRSIDCAVPNMASVVEPQDGEAVAAEAAGAAEPSAKRAPGAEGGDEEGGGGARQGAGEEGGSATGHQEGRRAARRQEGAGDEGVDGPERRGPERGGRGADRQATVTADTGQEGGPAGRVPKVAGTRRLTRRRGRFARGAGPPTWPEDLPGGARHGGRSGESDGTRRSGHPAAGGPAAAAHPRYEEGRRLVIRLATWNVNSLKVRLPRVEQWLAEVEPDIVCLQETKVADDAFPALTFASMGYESAHHGQGQWNGVAVLSKVGLDDVVTNFATGIDPDVDARIITATCAGIRVSSVYVPNGRSLDHEHYVYKLDWLGRLGSHVTSGSGTDGAVVVAGDFNIAPEDRDVYDPAKFVGATHVSEPERARLRELADHGLVDVFRRHYDGGGVYSWWDYRAGDFHEGRGMRIDLILATEPVAERIEWCAIDRNARKGKLPSDHAPVLVDLRD